MARKTIFILAVGVFVGMLAGGVMADTLGESPQSEQGMPSSEDREFVPEGNWSGSDWQVSGPVETGAIPAAVFEESWMREYGSD